VRHPAAEVVHFKDKLGGHGVVVTPQGPTYARIDEPVLVARSVDGLHPIQAEIPDELGFEKRRDESAGGGVDVYGHVQAALLRQPVQGRRDLGHRFVGAVEGGAEHSHHANGVLIARPDGALGHEVRRTMSDRYQSRLHLPVAAEFLPTDLDVGPHDQVWPAPGTPGPPPALEGEAAEHAGFTRAGGRAADRPGARGVPQVGQDAHAAALELRALRILVSVDQILVQALGDQLVRLRFHPCGHERGQVEARVAVQHELVVHELVGRSGVDPRLRQPPAGDHDPVVERQLRANPDRVVDTACRRSPSSFNRAELPARAAGTVTAERNDSVVSVRNRAQERSRVADRGAGQVDQ
jgi:hypothetical protein